MDPRPSTARRLLAALALVLVGLASLAPARARGAALQDADRAPRTILVAGATGNIGRHVVQDLLARGHRVRGLTRRPEAARQRVPAVEWVGGDLRERATLVPVVEGVDGIVYVAGARSWEDPTNTSEAIDFHGVAWLAELGREVGAERMVLVSSAWVTRERPSVSDHLRNVLKWKGMGEEALRSSGLDYAILRPLGMGNGPGGEMGVALLQGDTIEASVYIEREDLAAVAAECLFNPDARNKTFELFNAATFRIDGWKADLKKLRADRP